MKTMTCRQMGGSCDAQVFGNTPDEMVKNGSDHVRNLAEAGDESHKEILKMMDETSKDPAASQAWMDKFTEDFNATPED